MESLGRKTVYVETFVNKVSTKRQRERRIVYQNEDGTFLVNHHIGGRRKVVRNPNGNPSFYHRTDFRKINKVTIDDILSRIAA